MQSLKCTTCGSDNIEIRNIKHVVHGGNNAALLEVEAERCIKCGEVFFTAEQVEYFDEIRKKLKNEETDYFIQIGKYFRVKS